MSETQPRQPGEPSTNKPAPQEVPAADESTDTTSTTNAAPAKKSAKPKE